MIWCAHRFPLDTVDSSDGAQLGAETVDPLDEPESGELQPLSASILVTILYAAWYARPDLLRAVCRLASMVTKWTARCDRQLYRLVCYTHST